MDIAQQNRSLSGKKVGVFSGTFDPVHKGHLTFALEAMRQNSLDDVYFLPEQTPRRKTGVTHYAHRIAMLKLALQPYKNMHILELPDRQFGINTTLPRLRARFDGEIYLLMGSDTFASLAEYGWPNQDELFKKCSIITGLRLGQSEEDLLQLRARLPGTADIKFVQAANQHAASSDIRSALIRGKQHAGHLVSLSDYISENWLYVAVSKSR